MNIKIRKWKVSDLDNLVEFANNKNISDHLADAFPFPYTKKFGLKFIERVSNEVPTKIFAITIDDKAVGSIGIFPDTDIYRKNGAIAYWIAEPYWGKGIATAAIELIVAYGFNELDLTRIYAKPFETNVGSQRVLEKVGFQLEATIPKGVFKNNIYLDEKIYGMQKFAYDKKYHKSV